MNITKYETFLKQKKYTHTLQKSQTFGHEHDTLYFYFLYLLSPPEFTFPAFFRYVQYLPSL